MIMVVVMRALVQPVKEDGDIENHFGEGTQNGDTGNGGDGKWYQNYIGCFVMNSYDKLVDVAYVFVCWSLFGTHCLDICDSHHQ